MLCTVLRLFSSLLSVFVILTAPSSAMSHWLTNSAAVTAATPTAPPHTGTLVPVDAMALAKDVFGVVLVPTIAGVTINEVFPNIVKKIKPVLPLIGVFITTMLCASPVGQVSAVLKADGLQLCLPVAMLHAFAFALGYVICKLLNFNEKTARTVSIETGMQSAALGFLLAQANFADPLVAVPSAVSVVFMAIGGSGLAVFWRGRPVQDEVIDSIEGKIDDKVDDAKGARDKAINNIEGKIDDKIDDAEGAGDKVINSIKGKVDDAKGAGDKVINSIKGKIDGKVDDAEGARDKVASSIEGKVDDAKGAGDKVINNIEGKIDDKVDDAEGVQDKVVNSIEGKVDDAKGAGDKVINNIEGKIDDKVDDAEGVQDKVVNSIEGKVDDAKGAGDKVINNIKGKIDDAQGRR
jgi:uncharacterized protein YjbJ (UPF0337 family)